MTIENDVLLSSLTTLRIGGPARVIARCATEADLQAALLHAQESGLPWYMLGQGSNVLAPDEPLEAMIIQLSTGGITFEEATQPATGEAKEEAGSERGEQGLACVIAEAGASWDTLVRECAARELWGIENLAGIPGTAGAAPVQNIGAYGAELADTLLWVEAFDTQARALVRLSAGECGLSYRESRFKQEPRFIITRIALRLVRAPRPNVSYADLQNAKASGVPLYTPQQIGDAVRAIRSRKFPDLAACGTVGSFFKNPAITAAAYAALQETYPELPGFALPGGTSVKVPLAWILDRVLTLRGYRLGPVRLFETQPLVLVADFGATKRDVDALAADIAKRVRDATGIVIEREVRTLA
jgi:UDP-N-acetylmuramate dehydrogenase